MFDCVEGEIHIGKPLTIPRQLHNIADREITIGKKCVSLSLLTQKNLTNTIDIKLDRLLIHVNDVNKNCKKALRLCQSADSPYKSYHSPRGGFPSGTNWIDYIDWVWEEMYRLLVDEDQQQLLNLLDEEDMPQQD